jgi:uncharacterized membrane protein YeaQ/YmgE (transglycosylase-associated protein family)
VKNRNKYILDLILYSLLFIIFGVGAGFAIYKLINFNLFLNIFIGIIGVILAGYCFFYAFKTYNELKDYIKLLKQMTKCKYNISKNELESKLIELDYKKENTGLLNSETYLYSKGKSNILFVDGLNCPDYIKLNNIISDFSSSRNLIHTGLIVVVFNDKMTCKVEDMSRLNDSYNMLSNIIYLTLTDSKLCFNYVNDGCEYKIINIYKEFEKGLGD